MFESGSKVGQYVIPLELICLIPKYSQPPTRPPCLYPTVEDLFIHNPTSYCLFQQLVTASTDMGV